MYNIEVGARQTAPLLADIQAIIATASLSQATNGDQTGLESDLTAIIAGRLR